MDRFNIFVRCLKERRKLRRFGRRVNEQKRFELFYKNKHLFLGHTILDKTLCWRKTKEGHSFWGDEYKAMDRLEIRKLSMVKEIPITLKV